MIKFTKVTKAETGEPTKDKPTPPSPTVEQGAKRDSIPTLSEKSGGNNGEGKERKPLGIPLSVAPSVVMDKQPEKKTESGVEEVSPSPKEPTKRGPGRPPGSGKNSAPSKKAQAKISEVAGLARQIEGIHAMADIMIPGMAISTPNAQLMAEAMQGVIDAYGITVNEKTSSLLTLAGVVGIVEVPKIPIILRYLDGKKKPKQAIHQARQMSQQSVPIDNAPTPQPVPAIAEDKSGGLFTHVTNGIAEGNPNE